MALSGTLTIVRELSPAPAELYSAEGVLDFTTGLHFHPEVQLVLVLEGQRKFCFRDRELILHAGDCLIIPPYFPHRGMSLSDVPSTFKSLYVSRTCAEQFVELKAFFCEDHPAVVVHDDRFPDRFARAAAAPRKVELDSILQLMTIRDLSNARRIPCGTVALGTPARAALTRARTMLAAEIGAPPSLDLLARKVGISKFHLTRQFSRLYGMSPYAFNLRCRLNEAKALLAKGDTVSAVANDLGFFDQSHFGLHFRRVMGLTPATYQKKLS